MKAYFVNDNYKTTRPVVLSFDDLLDKETRERFGCETFIYIGDFGSLAEAAAAFAENH